MASIKRKPLPGSQSPDVGTRQPSSPQHEAEVPKVEERKDSVMSTPALLADPQSPAESERRPDFDEQLEHLELQTDNLPTEPSTPSLDGDVASTPAEESRFAKFKTNMGVAYKEARHFAGGVMSRPYEATKHVSVLRHSQGLVYYNGPETSIAITVFSDQALSDDRTLWLQKRGFSGKTGLKLGAKLGKRTAWIDVTPQRLVAADHLPRDDERAWQRDIAKFEKKTRETKHICAQRAVETDIVRIPYTAEDGYFRIVICAGKKVLCPSPVFRYASTSTSMGHLRGASLTTLPLELGLKLGAWAATSQVASSIQSVVDACGTGLSATAQFAAETAYDLSGASKKVDETVDTIEDHYDQQRQISLTRSEEDARAGADVTGDDDGEPVSPYPINFTARILDVFPNTHETEPECHLHLAKVPNPILLRPLGSYAAWVRPPEEQESDKYDVSKPSGPSWSRALVQITPAIKQATASVVEKRNVSVFIIGDPSDGAKVGGTLQVLLMRFLRATKTSTPDGPDAGAQKRADVDAVRTILARPAWAADITLQRMKSDLSQRSVTERIADARLAAQERVDGLQIHRLGVRTDSMRLQDEMIGKGGLYVRR